MKPKTNLKTKTKTKTKTHLKTKVKTTNLKTKMKPKILVAKKITAHKSKFEDMTIEDVKDCMVLSPQKTLYEVLHPDNNDWIKPYFDIDDKELKMLEKMRGRRQQRNAANGSGITTIE